MFGDQLGRQWAVHPVATLGNVRSVEPVAECSFGMARDMVLITLDMSMFGQPQQRPVVLYRMPVDMASATEPARGRGGATCHVGDEWLSQLGVGFVATELRLRVGYGCICLQALSTHAAVGGELEARGTHG